VKNFDGFIFILLDLSMVKHSYYEKNDDRLLSEDDRPFIRRLLTFTEYRPSWFHIIFLVFFFIICSCLIIYLYHYLFNQPKLMYSSLDKTSTKS
jgi:hypothetical protein